MAIDRPEVEKIAHLARLDITDDQIATTTSSLSDVLALVDQLQAADTAGIETLSHPLESDLDFEIFVVQSIPGEYRGSLPATVAPRWHWALRLPGDEGWRLDGTVTGADFASDGG